MLIHMYALMSRKKLQGAAKSGPLKFFAVFSATVWDFDLNFYLLTAPTSNCQEQCDFVEKLRSYRLFNINVHRFFSVKKLLS